MPEKPTINTEDLLRRFLSYVQLDTQSDPHSKTVPTTPNQWVLIRQLEWELRELGLADVKVTDAGYVLATVPSTTKKRGVPRIGFLAHVDTVSGCSGLAKPIVHRNYRGQPLVLPDDPSEVLTVENTPHLGGKIGEDVITASGRTLLGADDKSGIAAIMGAVKYLLANPEVKHGDLRLCFNPDEETGRGQDQITLEELACDFAYTLDAHGLANIDSETFSADRGVVTIRGVAAHPGWAKDVMVNAIRLAGEFLQSLPMELSPERTEGRQGFVHPTDMRGSAEEVTIDLILRDFEMDGLEAKRKVLEAAVARLREREPRAQVKLEISAQYRNMRYWLEKDMRPVEYAMEAMRRNGLQPTRESVRGGTDGSRLTERGLPTPNLFTGMHDIHSPREWISLQDMVKAAEVVVRLVELWEERA